MRIHVSPTLSALLATALWACTGAAFAQAVPPESTAQDLLPLPEPAPAVTGAAPVATMSDSFANLDRDKDGALTQREAERSEPVATAFQRLDQSHDGTLDLAEYAQLRSPAARRN